MRIKEVKTKKSKSQVNELKLSSLIGNYGSAVASQMRGQNAGMTTQDIMTQNIFSKNFVSSALTSLNNAVKGGIVDPMQSPPRAAVAGDFNATPNPFGDYDEANKIKQQRAQQAQAAKDKAASDAAQSKINKAAAASASPAATAAADARVARAQQAQATQPASVSDKLDRAAAQRGKAPFVKTKQNTPGNQPPMPRVRESSYNRLNALFENILETVLPQERNTYSIKDYLKKVWYPQFMKGVDWKPNEAKIDQLLQQVQDTYNKDKGQAALKQLASLSLSISPRKPEKEKEPTEPEQQAGAAKKKEEPITATWGKIKYTKTNRGWLDPNGRLADANTSKYLDQAVEQSKNPPPPKPSKGGKKKQPSITPPADAVNKNVVPIKKTA